MTDVTKMTDEELIAWAQVYLEYDGKHVDNSSVTLGRELAARLEAALRAKDEEIARLAEAEKRYAEIFHAFMPPEEASVIREENAHLTRRYQELKETLLAKHDGERGEE